VFDSRQCKSFSPCPPEHLNQRRVRKLHNEDLRDLYSSPSIVRIKVEEDEVGGTCGTNGGEEELV
jgi:hypothetical protein